MNADKAPADSRAHWVALGAVTLAGEGWNTEVSCSCYNCKKQVISRIKRTESIPNYDFALEHSVFLLKTFPGMSPTILSRIIESGYNSIVIEGFGSGNIPTKENSLTDAIGGIVEAGYPVVISTQCAFGQADFSLYEVGKAALDVRAMSAHDMTSEAALVKLMWVLGHTSDLNEIEEMMITNYVGELLFQKQLAFVEPS